MALYHREGSFFSVEYCVCYCTNVTFSKPVSS